MDKFNWIKSYLLSIIFEQHLSSKNSLNIVFVVAQIIVLTIGILFKEFIKISAITNFMCLIFIFFNNYIHDKAWEKAKNNLDKIFEEEK